MRVKLNCTMLGKPSASAGDVIDLPRDRALKMIERGQAQPLTKRLTVGLRLDSHSRGQYAKV